MKRITTICIAVLSAILIAGLIFSPTALVEVREVPPDGDYETYVAILESKRCYDRYLAARLATSGHAWSYDQLRWRVMFKALPKEKKLQVRVLISSRKKAEDVAHAAQQSLYDFLAAGPS